MKNLMILSFLILSACGDSKLPRYTALNKLRILSLVADKPEVDFNSLAFTDTIQFSPWISDLYGGGRALTHSLECCLDPGVSLGAKPTCAGNPSRVVEFTDSAIAATATFASPEFTGKVTPFNVDLSAMAATPLALAQARFAAASTNQQFNGLSFLFVYQVKASATESVTAIKKIIFSSAAKTTKNSNPNSLSIQTNAVDLETAGLPAVEADIFAVWPTSVAESYASYQVDGTLLNLKEKLEMTWFMTGPQNTDCDSDISCSNDGYFKFTRTLLDEANRYTPPTAAPSGRKIAIVGVLYDKRGGMVVRPYYCVGPGAACTAVP